MDDKKKFIDTIRSNKDVIIKRTLIIAGAALGLTVAAVVAKRIADAEMESLDSMDDGIIIDIDAS